MEKKRTTDLFRFATLRAPQQLSEQRHALGFIYHPDHNASAILANVDLNVDTLAEMKITIANNVGTFSPLSKVSEVKEIHTKLFEFAHWLSVNKNVLERSELDAIITDATTPAPLTNSDYISIWDNVYYDLVAEENPTVRQACLQCIVAHNFIENYQGACRLGERSMNVSFHRNLCIRDNNTVKL
jgi:hypothetical protein